MPKPLSLLLVEDSEDDATLLLRHLRQHGYDVTSQRVETAADLKTALTQKSWDVVISDYVMPLFSGLEAVKVLREINSDLPIIILSGKIGEDTLVAALKAGASDYIMKTNLKRLVPAIDREIQEAAVRLERTRATEALKQSEEQLKMAQKMEQLKDEFIGLVSHELRTPLTVILGALDTVNSDWDRLPKEQVRQLVGDALFEAESLSGILANLLVLARAQAGRLELVQEPVNVRQVIESVIRRIKPQPLTHRIVVDVDHHLPMIAADPVRLERIIHNLIDNAMKFSNPGTEITVTARLRDNEVLVGVQDCGIGISAPGCERLFKPFEQLNDPSSNRRGTGLGLVVCRRLVEAHRGRIWVESEPGQGSAFFFTMPLLENIPD